MRVDKYRLVVGDIRDYPLCVNCVIFHAKPVTFKPALCTIDGSNLHYIVSWASISCTTLTLEAAVSFLSVLVPTRMSV